jgi:hypothetical protein
MHAIQLTCWQSEEYALTCPSTQLGIVTRRNKCQTRDLNLTKSTMTEKVQLAWCCADMPLRRMRCVLLASLEKLAPQMTLLCITETSA